MTDSPKWTTRDCPNYIEYLKLISSLTRCHFQLRGNPRSVEDTRDLQDLVDKENEVVRVTHFDSDGHRNEGQVEIYVMYRYK